MNNHKEYYNHYDCRFNRRPESQWTLHVGKGVFIEAAQPTLKSLLYPDLVLVVPDLFNGADVYDDDAIFKGTFI